MFSLKEYITPSSLEEAYELLNKNKNNVILGGLLWLKMGNKNYNMGIDLSKLGLDTIIETEPQIEVGCMTTLRQIETSSVLNTCFDGIVSASVKNIVGVQFRNCATVGGSVYSRFGFSDLLTALLALDCYVHMHKGGIIPLEKFIKMPYEKDILIKIIIKKDGSRASYKSCRMTATDFPILAVALSRCNSSWKIAVGARPNKAALAAKASKLLPENPTKEDIASACETVTSELHFGTNLRGSAEYRKELAKVLVKRGVEEICR
ncbi:MAG: hcrB2 [Clostridia bacterium]|nr:hcrB2 [Clostridia bacterium]